MEYRNLGRSGLKVSALSFGAATFGGKGELFSAWGHTDVKEASRLIDICLDHGINLFDTADIYSQGASEQILGQAIKGKRERLLVSTKATFRFGSGENNLGSSRSHLIESCDASLKRLEVDHIDLYLMHGFDAQTPIEETLKALDMLIASGKVRYIGCSNFSGWHLMKSLSISERQGWDPYVVHQAYYSLVGRDYEWELMPLALDQKIGTMVWSPLGWGRLTGKIGRNKPLPAVSRLHETKEQGPHIDDEYLYRVVDVLEQMALETGKSVPQIALNWLLKRPTVCNVIIGARNEEQLRNNIGAADFSLSEEQMERLDRASMPTLPYPYWHQRGFSERNPSPV